MKPSLQIGKPAILLIMVALLSATGACRKDPPDVPDPVEFPETDITLDELEDKGEYGEGMIVDARVFQGEETDHVVLNDSAIYDPLALDLTTPGYYGIEVHGNSGGQPRVIRVVVLDPERGTPEWGLPPWTPRGPDMESIGNQEVRLVHPAGVPPGSVFPLVVMVDGELTASLVNLEASAGSGAFLIKRGSGSTWISAGDDGTGELVIGHRSFPVEPVLLTEAPIALGGMLTESIRIPDGTLVEIGEDLTIPAGVVLTIGQGAYVSVAPATDIHLAGSLVVQGTAGSPVVFTCSDPEDYWGGVIGKGSGNRVEASHAIFGRSGFHAGGDYSWGHAHRQALFYAENGSIRLDHCYMIDHIGQVFYTESSIVELSQCLIQRAKTGGQLNGTSLTIDRSVFTDFPDDTDQYRDEDNDALYLVNCVAHISRSFFMFAKDDGIDSGSGSYGGDVTVTRSRFESVFHEGAALSGGTTSSDKIQRFYNCLFLDCGQGLELGFSAPNHTVIADSCRFLRNGIGIRYGDNYDFGNYGTLHVSNSESLGNVTRDVWNMDRKDWEADTAHMVFENVWVSRAVPMYPELQVRGK